MSVAMSTLFLIVLATGVGLVVFKLCRFTDGTMSEEDLEAYDRAKHSLWSGSDW